MRSAAIRIQATVLLVLAVLAPCCGGGGGGGGVAAPSYPPLFGLPNSFPSLLAVVNSGTGRSASVTRFGMGAVRNVAGLARHPSTGTIYGVDPSLGLLVTLDPATGKSTGVGPTSVTMNGLAWHGGTNTLYATDADQFYRIDPSSGGSTRIGPLGFTGVRGLAYHVPLSTLFGLDGTTNQLISIDPATGAGTVVGALGSTGLRGFTFDAPSGLLYAASISDLFTVNPATGAATLVGSHLSNSVFGLVSGTSAGSLLGVDRLDGELVSIDTATANATRVVAIGFGDVRGLTFSPDGSILYGINSRTGRFLRISPVTGEAVEVGAARIEFLQADNYGDLTVDPTGPVYYAVNATRLCTIDPATGLGTSIAITGTASLLRGLSYNPGNSTLYASSDTELFTLNPATGAATLLGSLGAVQIRGLAHHPDGTLYGINANPGRLVSINPGGPTVTPITNLSNMPLAGLAIDPVRETFFTTNLTQATLIRLHQSSFRESGVGLPGFDGIGLALNPDLSVAYSVNPTSSTLFKLNLLSGEGTAINSPGGATLANVIAVAYRRSPAALFATTVTDQLLGINPSTGATSTLGPLGAVSMQGLAYDDLSGKLYGVGVNIATPALFSIDTATGTATPIVNLATAYQALAFDAATGRLLAYRSDTRALAALDPVTGAETPIGQAGWSFRGLTPPLQGAPLGSLSNPLILDTYGTSSVVHSGVVGRDRLYIKVVNIPFLNNSHTVELTGLSDNANLTTFTDAFITVQQSSANPGTAGESCTGTTTGTGELYLLIDGTGTAEGSTFILQAET